MKLKHRSIWNVTCGIFGIMLGMAMTWIVCSEFYTGAPVILTLKIIIMFACYIYGYQYLLHAYKERKLLKRHKCRGDIDDRI